MTTQTEPTILLYSTLESPVGELLLVGDGERLRGLHFQEGLRPVRVQDSWRCAEEPFAEGIIDFLRSVEGAEIVALIREPPTQNGPTRRVSLRTRGTGIDVSAIARKSGGGGHRQAAGFSSES